MQTILPTLEEIQSSVSKAGVMMVDVNRRISQWDQARILGAIGSGAGKTQIVGARQPSQLSRAASMAPDDDGPRASAVPGLAAAAEAGKAAATEGAALTVPDQGLQLASICGVIFSRNSKYPIVDASRYHSRHPFLFRIFLKTYLYDTRLISTNVCNSMFYRRSSDGLAITGRCC